MNENLHEICRKYRSLRREYLRKQWGSPFRMLKRWFSQQTGWDQIWNAGMCSSYQAISDFQERISKYAPNMIEIENFKTCLQTFRNDVEDRLFYLALVPFLLAALTGIWMNFEIISVSFVALLYFVFILLVLVERANLKTEKMICDETLNLLNLYVEDRWENK